MADKNMSEDCAVPRKDEPRLATNQIQGNIMPGFNKDFQWLLFLKIVHLPSFKRWLRNLIPSVTTMAQVLDFRSQLKRSESQLPATWMNIGFSYAALKQLNAFAGDKDFDDEAFRQGLWQRSEALGDPTNPESEGHPENWLVGGEQKEAHLIIIIASDSQQDLSAAVARLKATIDAPGGGGGALIIFEQPGAVLPGPLAGHEHFGFRDGISQPGVRGRISKEEEPDGFLTPGQNPRDKHQGKPGQDLVWPGEFVFGYRGQDAKKPVECPGTTVEAGPSWAKNGSFLVFRRLRQDVGAFHQFLHETAQRLNMDSGLFGAKCVGRWTSGAPILKAPDLDNAGLAKDDLRNNDFEFDADDAKGQMCPFAGHIRKTYPRDDVKCAEVGLPSDQQTLNESITQTHRLLRRGIPYGEPSRSAVHAPVHDGDDRGLLFLAYQTSIVKQFEFIQKFANNPDLKDARTGHDPIIGQSLEKNSRKREFAVTFKDYEGKEWTEPVHMEKDWVIPTGGGYFFAPSIKTLKETLAK